MGEIRVRLPLQHPDKLGTIVLVCAALLCVAQIVVLWAAPGGWEQHCFRDDAYYQFAVARNLADGQGFTFDGEHPAGGVQVLWTVLLSCFTLCLGPGPIESVAFVLGIALHGLAALLVVRIALLFAPRIVAWAIAAYYVSRPTLIAEALNGQETALAMFALLVWARRALEIEQSLPTSRRGFWIWTLLLPWVRTDLLVFPVGLAIWSQATRLIGGTPRRPGDNEFALLCSVGLYLLLQKLWFGRWLPVSGFAIPWLFHDAFALTAPTLRHTLTRYWWFARPIALGGPYTLAGFGFGIGASWCLLAPLAWRKRFLPVLLVLVAGLFGARDLAAPFLAGVLLLSTSAMSRSVATIPTGRALTGLWLGFVMLLVLHLPVRWYPRDYYLVVGAAAGVATLALLGGRWLAQHGLIALIPLERRLRVFWIGLAVLLAVDGFVATRRFAWQAEMSFAARMTTTLVGEDRAIAAFNSGLLGWHHPGTVSNLDGVVDGAALADLRAGRLADWMVERDVEFVLDSPRQLGETDPDPISPHASGRYLGGPLLPVVAFDLAGVGGHHKGTECQMLWALPDVAQPELSEGIVDVPGPGTVVALKTREGEAPARYVLEQDGREAPLSFAESALAAPWIVTRFDGAHGRIRRSGQVVVEW